MKHSLLQPSEDGKLMNKTITKTNLYNFDSLKPLFCMVKVEFTWVNIIFLISARRGGSYEYPQSMF